MSVWVLVAQILAARASVLPDGPDCIIDRTADRISDGDTDREAADDPEECLACGSTTEVVLGICWECEASGDA